MNTIIIAVLTVAVIGLIAGIGLSVASVLLDVPKDEKEVKIRECLPGANCGGCGFSGCDAYAAEIAAGKCAANLCAPGGAETAKSIAEIMGFEDAGFTPMAALVMCNGGCENTEKSHNYRGLGGCAAKNTLFAGDIACKYGCLGEGDCRKVCPNGCITIVNGLAKIDRENCIGCGKCVTACPKNIIKLTPKNKNAKYVACANTEKGATAKSVCKSACIGCGLCLKQCEFGAIVLRDNLAEIDPQKCTNCGKCAEKCVRKCIH